MTGCSVLAEHNIAPGTAVAIRLTLPPRKAGTARDIVDVDGRIVYTVLSSGRGQFRCGIQFRRFREGGLDTLWRAISLRT